MGQKVDGFAKHTITDIEFVQNESQNNMYFYIENDNYNS